MDPGRHPSNLQGLLRFALDYTRSEDAPNASDFEQMDPERREFLEKALHSMTIDVIAEFEKAIGILDNRSASVEEKVDALNVVRDYIDNIDFANNFIKVGGSTVILESLRHENSKLRTCAAYIIAEMSQNNPFCQKHFLEADVLTLLVSYLQEDEDVASSAMHAISSLIRSYEPACAAFLKIGGLECIIGCLQSAHCKVFVKSCFLISALSSEYPIVQEQFVKLGTVEELAKCVEPITGFDLKIETVLSALNALSQTPEGKRHLAKTKISSLLLTVIDMNEGKAECEEILEYSKGLLNCLQQDDQTCADR